MKESNYIHYHLGIIVVAQLSQDYSHTQKISPVIFTESFTKGQKSGGQGRVGLKLMLLLTFSFSNSKLPRAPLASAMVSGEVNDEYFAGVSHLKIGLRDTEDLMYVRTKSEELVSGEC